VFSKDKHKIPPTYSRAEYYARSLTAVGMTLEVGKNLKGWMLNTND
jgi:hypothetical protein